MPLIDLCNSIAHLTSEEFYISMAADGWIEAVAKTRESKREIHRNENKINFYVHLLIFASICWGYFFFYPLKWIFKMTPPWFLVFFFFLLTSSIPLRYVVFSRAWASFLLCFKIWKHKHDITTCNKRCHEEYLFPVFLIYWTVKLLVWHLVTCKWSTFPYLCQKYVL